MTTTQLYNNKGEKIYPATLSDNVTYENEQFSNVKDALNFVMQEISKTESEATTNLIFEVNYLRSKSSDEAEIRESTSWNPAFQAPNSDYPYTWKKTKYSYIGDTSGGTIKYEIVATDLAEILQNIYIATSDSGTPTIDYQKIDDGQGNKVENLSQYDNQLPQGWTETPQAISPSTPYLFMSTRKKSKGKWGRFSNPAQIGRWAFDSRLEVRYQVISDQASQPTIDATQENPEGWLSVPPQIFSGKMYMITASSVNGVLNKDSEGNIWAGPILMAIVE